MSVHAAGDTSDLDGDHPAENATVMIKAVPAARLLRLSQLIRYVPDCEAAIYQEIQRVLVQANGVTLLVRRNGSRQHKERKAMSVMLASTIGLLSNKAVRDEQLIMKACRLARYRPNYILSRYRCQVIAEKCLFAILDEGTDGGSGGSRLLGLLPTLASHRALLVVY
jgi:hypothetical protein